MSIIARDLLHELTHAIQFNIQPNSLTYAGLVEIISKCEPSRENLSQSKDADTCLFGSVRQYNAGKVSNRRVHRPNLRF